MTKRERIARMTNEEYVAYIRKREAKKQRAWRKRMKQQGVIVASNIAATKRAEFYASK